MQKFVLDLLHNSVKTALRRINPPRPHKQNAGAGGIGGFQRREKSPREKEGLDRNAEARGLQKAIAAPQRTAGQQFGEVGKLIAMHDPLSALPCLCAVPMPKNHIVAKQLFLNIRV